LFLVVGRVFLAAAQAALNPVRLSLFQSLPAELTEQLIRASGKVCAHFPVTYAAVLQ